MFYCYKNIYLEVLLAGEIVGWCNANANCQDAIEDDFEFVEAYTHMEYYTVPYDCRGPLALYKKWGKCLVNTLFIGTIILCGRSVGKLLNFISIYSIL